MAAITKKKKGGKKRINRRRRHHKGRIITTLFPSNNFIEFITNFLPVLLLSSPNSIHDEMSKKESPPDYLLPRFNVGGTLDCFVLLHSGSVNFFSFPRVVALKRKSRLILHHGSPLWRYLHGIILS